MDASGTDDLDEYGQIIGLFQRIAQRTGHSVSSLIVEWALLHACTNMVEKRETIHQQAFEERVNKAIELVGEFFFVNFISIDYIYGLRVLNLLMKGSTLCL